MTKRILIVEDDPAIRMLIQGVLEPEGYETFVAVDGVTALPAAREARPDVILLDIGLPGLDGFGVLDLLKADPELRGVPVLMVTAWAEPELVAKAMDRGARAYVRKPFDINELREQVAAAFPRDDEDDPVTGLAGRDRLSAELARRDTCSVVLLALDTEEVPDATLHAVSRRLDGRVRRGDLLGRWGYGTFLVIADADLGGAGALAEDLRCSLADRPIDTVASGRRVTASIGVAQSVPGESPQDLLQRAASAVTAAQLGGRNAVRLADSAPIFA